MDSIEQYLQQVESKEAGQWSIDIERALEMTAQFTFPEWEWWVLKFVQSAVTLDATRIDLQLGPSCWSLCHDGQGLPDFSLIDALRPETPDTAARRHLALATRVALLKGGSLELTLHYASRCLHWRYPDAPQLQSTAAIEGWEGTQLRLRHEQLKEPGTKIKAFLRDALRHAPVPVYLNDALLNDPRFDHGGLPQWVWLAPRLTAQTLPVVPSGNCSWLVSPSSALNTEADTVTPLADCSEPRLDFAAGLRVLPCWGWQKLVPVVGRHTLKIVHHGVLLRVGDSERQDHPAGSVTLFSSAGLTLDATGTRALANDRLDDRIRATHANFRRLFRAYSRWHAKLDLARLAQGY